MDDGSTHTNPTIPEHKWITNNEGWSDTWNTTTLCVNSYGFMNIVQSHYLAVSL